MGVSVTRFALAALVVALVAACNSNAPPRGPEDTCAKSCEGRDHNCTREECWRGCNLVLDRLAEHEGDRVIDCVASTTTSCADRVWARCAVRVGPHADGGPGAPPAPTEIEDVDLE